MFDTLLASPTIGAPKPRAVMAALLLHVLLIVAAVRSTATPHGGARPVARDTIRLELTRISPLEEKRMESPPFLPEAGIPEPPRVPDIPINAPELQPPRLSFTALPAPGSGVSVQRNSEAAVPVDSSPLALGASVLGTVEVDELPELLEELRPRYPRELERARVGGLVQLQYVVGSDGRVDQRSVRVLGSTHPAFMLAALQALRNSRFKPARRGGRPVAVLVQQTFSFRHQSYNPP